MLVKKNPNIEALKFLAPALIATLIVHIIPILCGIYISFINLDRTNITQLFTAPFCGFKNYITLFSFQKSISGIFMNSLKNILLFALTIPATMIIAYSIALLLNKKIVLRTIIRGIVLLPWITPDSVMFNVFRFIFQARIGIVNMYLIKFGLIQDPLIWLVGDRAMIAVIIAAIWKYWPYTSLVLLAGLQNIPKDLLEAAKIDGANIWQRFWSVIFPTMWPITRTMLLLSFIWNFHAFNQFYVMLGGDTSAKAAVPALVILEEGYNGLHYSLGSTMAVTLSVIIFIFTFFAIILRKDEAR